MWQIRERLVLKGNFFDAIKDLREATSYAIKTREGDSENWLPQRGLREGCPTSPVLFNIFHQVVIRKAEEKRQSRNSSQVGIPWRHIVQDKIPGPNQFGKYNSECQESHLTMSLFAEDTTMLGAAREIRTGCDAVKKTMQSFEEKNNTLKEEKQIFGAEQSADIRMLGCWVDPRIDSRNRIARAAKLGKTEATNDQG